MTIQSTVYAAVAARGYADDLKPEEFAARQVAKLAEELGEFAECFSGLPPYVQMDINLCAQTCRGNFDNRRNWLGAMLNSRECAAKELADMQVVLFCAAQALGIDVLAEAERKAADDVQRGVR